MKFYVADATSPQRQPLREFLVIHPLCVSKGACGYVPSALPFTNGGMSHPLCCILVT